jgi:hypothetical protein
MSAQNPEVIAQVKGIEELLPECLAIARAAHE